MHLHVPWSSDRVHNRSTVMLNGGVEHVKAQRFSLFAMCSQVVRPSSTRPKDVFNMVNLRSCEMHDMTAYIYMQHTALTWISSTVYLRSSGMLNMSVHMCLQHAAFTRICSTPPATKTRTLRSSSERCEHLEHNRRTYENRTNDTEEKLITSYLQGESRSCLGGVALNSEEGRGETEQTSK